MKLVPPSIHPDCISRYRINNATTGEPLVDEALNALIKAAEFSHDVCSRVEETFLRVMSNQMATPIANEKTARDTIFRMQESATKRIDAAILIAMAERDSEIAKFAHPPKAKNVDEATVASDIRAALSRMPAAQRRKAVDAAISAGEDAVVSAVLNAPSLTSGFNNHETVAIRSNWQRLRFPQEVSRAGHLDRAADDLLRGAQSMIGYCNSFTNSARISAAVESEARASAAQH